MPEPPYAPLTFVSENALTDTIYSLGIIICFHYGLTAFACIWYFRHELFVNAQSFVFKLVFPLLLARFHQFDRREAKGVGDMPIATQDLGGTSEFRPHSVVPADVVSSRPPLPTSESAGRRE